MAQLIKPQNVKIVTRDGELLISLQLDININLNQIGSVVASDDGNIGNTPFAKKMKNDDDDVQWAIPEFKPTEKIKFGK